jgi:inhibitor of cysteine peptidase
MTNKVLVALMLIGVLFTMAACSATAGAPNENLPNNQVPPAPNKYLVNISAEDFNKEANVARQVEVKSGDIFTIALDSNATTGFQWTVQANITDVNILQQTSHDCIAPNATALGKAGIEEWTFKAGHTGTTKVTLSYNRPWEGGEKGVRTFELTVVVK